MKKFFISILLTIFICSLGQSQRYFDERYVFTQAFLHPALINPGAIAINEGQSILLNYRNNWATFGGNPKTISVMYDGLISDRLGMGVQFLQDNFGALQTSKGQLSFSYIIKSSVNKIGFGLSAEYIKHGINNYGVSSPFTLPDELINQRREGVEYVDASFGVHGVYNDQFTYGIALPSLISSRIDNAGGENSRELGFILNLGYKVASKQTGISLVPSVLVKKLNHVPTHIDLNLKLGFLEDKLTGGITYTVGAEKKLGFIVGLNVDRIGFYYTYNVSPLEFQTYSNGGHEISAKIALGSMKSKETTKGEMPLEEN